MNVQNSVVDLASSSVVVELGGMTSNEFIRYFLTHQEGIDGKLMTAGAIKFDGVRIDTLDDFQQIVNSVSHKFLNYVDGNSPRTKLTGNVYTSTEYDQSQKITMHNELSYSARWPNKLFFSCLQPAASGGETLLADSREILERMDPAIVRAIEEKNIIYIRNLHSGTGIGPSWQYTFETGDKADVEKYCRALGIDFEWRMNDTLRLFQPSRGIIRHRQTKEKVWFNQIDQFHPTQLGEEVCEALVAMYDTPEDFPMFVRFGDGGEIPEEMVQEILQTIAEVTLAPEWQRNQLLIIDNELICHGRNPYTGSRKVLVAMSE
jgi:hypothetical protein